MRLKFLMQRAFRRTISRNLRNTVTVTLCWDSGVKMGDVNDLATWTGSSDPLTEDVKALVYFPSPATLLNRGFTEIVEGDAIVDFDPLLRFAGRRNLTFLIDGFRYVQKSVGKQVTEYYDLLIGGERIMRTCVLTRTGGVAALGQGILRYIDGSGSADLYTYDFNAQEFARMDAEDTRLVLPGGDDDHEFRVLINGTLALAVDTGLRLLTHALILDGEAVDLPSPRVEFLAPTARVAVLGQDGTLIAPAFLERQTAPAVGAQFSLSNAGGDWLATLGRDGVTARALSDELA